MGRFCVAVAAPVVVWRSPGEHSSLPQSKTFYRKFTENSRKLRVLFFNFLFYNRWGNEKFLMKNECSILIEKLVSYVLIFRMLCFFGGIFIYLFCVFIRLVFWQFWDFTLTPSILFVNCLNLNLRNKFLNGISILKNFKNRNF